MRRRAGSGFTLAEALISLLLMAGCLGLLAGLFSETSQFLASRGDADASLRAVQVAVNMLDADLSQAVAGTASASTATLTFDRVFGPPAEQPTPRVLVKVTYLFDTRSGQLMRQSHGNSLTVATSVRAFETSVVSGDLVSFTVEAQAAQQPPVRVASRTRLLVAGLPPSLVEYAP